VFGLAANDRNKSLDTYFGPGLGNRIGFNRRRVVCGTFQKALVSESSGVPPLKLAIVEQTHLLRITTHKEATVTIVDLEGKLMGPWVAELEQCWRAIAAGESIIVRLNAVSFIDDRGKMLLSAIRNSGAELIAEGCMTRAIVEAISAKQKD
jgi:hypothetical protein